MDESEEQWDLSWWGSGSGVRREGLLLNPKVIQTDVVYTARVFSHRLRPAMMSQAFKLSGVG